LALAYTGLGASNEAGEVAGKIKKIIRDGYGDRPMEKKLAILDEVGDTLWYLAQVCNELGLDMSSAATRNVAKLGSRAERGVLGGSGDTR
jgi:NTP pyrophosphatase (non-canonical NTP hydrolase)